MSQKIHSPTPSVWCMMGRFGGKLANKQCHFLQKPCLNVQKEMICLQPLLLTTIGGSVEVILQW